MTSQINVDATMNEIPKGEGLPSTRKRSGGLLPEVEKRNRPSPVAIQAQYEDAFPAERERIARAVREAEEAAWDHATLRHFFSPPPPISG